MAFLGDIFASVKRFEAFK